MAAINMPSRPDDGASGLAAIGSIYNAFKGEDAQTRKLKELQAQQMENSNSGYMNPAQRAEIAKYTKQASEGTEGATPIYTMTPDGPVKEWVVGIKDQESALNTEAKRLAIEKQRRDLNAEKKGKTLPATEAQSLGDANSSFQALQDANQKFQDNASITGPFQGRVSSLAAWGQVGDRGKQAANLDAELKKNAQTIGKYLEGGKLTNEDIDRYKKLLPTITDDPSVAAEKAKILQTMIAQKQAAQKETFGQAGYDVSNIRLSQAPMAGGPSMGVPNPTMKASVMPDTTKMSREQKIKFLQGK